MSKTIHVYPVEEEQLHTLDGERGRIGLCECCPEYEFEAGGVVVVHQRIHEHSTRAESVPGGLH